MGILHLFELFFEGLNFEFMFFLVDISIEINLGLLFGELSDAFFLCFKLLLKIIFDLAAELFFEEFLISDWGERVF
jgi:hypothetical protein